MSDWKIAAICVLVAFAVAAIVYIIGILKDWWL